MRAGYCHLLCDHHRIEEAWAAHDGPRGQVGAAQLALHVQVADVVDLQEAMAASDQLLVHAAAWTLQHQAPSEHSRRARQVQTTRTLEGPALAHRWCIGCPHLLAGSMLALKDLIESEHASHALF